MCSLGECSEFRGSQSPVVQETMKLSQCTVVVVEEEGCVDLKGSS